MPAPIHFHYQTRLLPGRVEPAAPPPIPALNLTVRLGQPEPPHQGAEIKLRQGLGATRDICQRRPDERPAAHPRAPADRPAEI